MYLYYSYPKYNYEIVIGFFNYLEYWIDSFIKRIESQPQYIENGKAEVPISSGLSDPPIKTIQSTASFWAMYG